MNDRNMELQHGGNIYDKEVRYDLSVNINPAGMPDIINDAIRRGEERIGCYPEYGAEFIVQDTSVRVMNVIKDNTCLNHRRHLPVLYSFPAAFTS